MPVSLPRRFRTALLWIEAVVCFGPLVSMLAFGLMLLPIWIFSLVADVTGLMPNVERAESIWSVVLNIALVGCGAFGIAGVFIILEELTTGVAKLPRWQRLVMIALGIIGATGFLWSQPIDARERPALFVMFYVLPFISTAHLLFMVRHLPLGRQHASSAVVPRA